MFKTSSKIELRFLERTIWAELVGLLSDQDVKGVRRTQNTSVSADFLRSADKPKINMEPTTISRFAGLWFACNKLPKM